MFNPFHCVVNAFSIESAPFGDQIGGVVIKMTLFQTGLSPAGWSPPTGTEPKIPGGGYTRTAAAYPLPAEWLQQSGFFVGAREKIRKDLRSRLLWRAV
jgi:hypothetical protein